MCGCKDNVASERHHSPDSFGLAQYMVSFQSNMEKSSVGVSFLPQPDVLFQAISVFWTVFVCYENKVSPCCCPSHAGRAMCGGIMMIVKGYIILQKKKINKLQKGAELQLTKVEFLNI